jgi:aminoglycoside phosphotransferase (APT) family kinase protein
VPCAPDEVLAATWRLEGASVDVLREIPGRRLTARCRLALSGADGERRRITLIAKHYARADLARRLARHLRTLRFGPGGPPVRIPRLLGLDGRRGLVFMEALPGDSLELALAGASLERELEAAGALLANFHLGAALVEKQVTRQDELERVVEAEAAIAHAFPELGPRLAGLRRALQRMPWPSGGKPALLHGSFRPSHVMLHRGELALFDLESLRRGPAGYDLANWITALHYREAERRITRAARRRATRLLLRGFRAQGGDESCALVLWLAAALLLQKQVLKYAKRRHDRGRERARTLLARAEGFSRLAEAAPASARLDALLELVP